MKQKPVKKAWKVWYPLDSNYDIYCSTQNPVYAETREQARTKYEGDMSNIGYIDIKAIRWKEMDVYEYDGRTLSKSRIDREEAKKERNRKLQELPEGLYYIQNGYCGNNVVFWGPNGAGYTSNVANAGKYTKEEMLKIMINGREEDKVWPAKEIETNLISVVDSQYLNYKLKV